jgi:prevent-host-death family protein
MGSDEARTNWGLLLDRIQRGEVVFVTRHGRKAAVMLSPEQYEDLQEQARLSREIADEQEREGE